MPQRSSRPSLHAQGGGEGEGEGRGGGGGGGGGGEGGGGGAAVAAKARAAAATATATTAAGRGGGGGAAAVAAARAAAAAAVAAAAAPAWPRSAKEVAVVRDHGGGARDRLVIEVRVALAPAPRRKEPAAAPEVLGQRVALAGGRRRRRMASIPIAERVRRVRLVALRGLHAPAAGGGARLHAAHVGLRVVKVVEAGHRDVEVRHLAHVGGGRTAVLFHDNRSPVRVHRSRVAHEDAAAAAAQQPSIFTPVAAAAAVVLPKQLRQRVRRRARHPQPLAVLRWPAKVVRVLRLVARRAGVSGRLPGLEEGSVAALAVAVPVVRRPQRAGPGDGGHEAARRCGAAAAARPEKAGKKMASLLFTFASAAPAHDATTSSPFLLPETTLTVAGEDASRRLRRGRYRRR